MEAGQARPVPDETGWAPRECTLPTTERPLRLAEFDALFGEAVTEVRPAGRGRVRLVLRAEPEVAGRAAERRSFSVVSDSRPYTGTAPAGPTP